MQYGDCLRKMKDSKLNKIIKICLIIMILGIIIMSYYMGIIRGILLGINLIQIKNNKTMCDFLNKTRDSDGFCLLKNETYKYRWFLDCGWERFKIRGNQTPPFILKYTEYARRIIYYPAMGC